MDIEEIKAHLENDEPQQRLRGLRELRLCSAEVAIPLLQRLVDDSEFLVRSQVAMGLGNKQSDAAFESLCHMLKNDRDHNVRAEAANSLALYGKPSLTHLITAFKSNQNWLVHRSIIAALLDFPASEAAAAALYEVCVAALTDVDFTVTEAAIEALGQFANSPREADALSHLLPLVSAQGWRVRRSVARSLKCFNTTDAQAARQTLSQDDDYRVVRATLSLN
ncbi:MAG: HEAT repeat domain-containing protein [Spirulina sp. SIO3F2]|nr:HEAT repeat domain-containing protein [Spirulina sp. SIO3F2]